MLINNPLFKGVVCWERIHVTNTGNNCKATQQTFVVKDFVIYRFQRFYMTDRF